MKILFLPVQLLPALPVIAALLVPACDLAGDRILQTGTGEVLSFAEVAGDLASVPLIFVGELHDRRSHHRAQLRVLEALHERGGAIAIGLEMFHQGHQEDLDRWVGRTLSVEEFLPVYYHNWSLPWALYRDIFLFARESGLPMVALNASPEITRQVAAHGFDSLSPDQLARLPGVSCNVDAEYEEFIRQSHGRHGEGGARFTNFCEAQMVWDSVMSAEAVRFLEENPGRTLVVLAGSGHSWKRGIPAQVRQRSSLPLRTVLPEVEGRLTRNEATEEDTDYLWLGI